MTKVQYRKALLELRENLPPSFVRDWGEKICMNFFKSQLCEVPGGRSIMLYSSFRNEASTEELVRILYEKGCSVLLPLIVNMEISPREYRGAGCLRKGCMGIPEPDDKLCPLADISKIHTVLVPGVVFDRYGGRIGFGKGCYDRFLLGLPEDAVIIGLCYDFQIAAEPLPSEPHDIKMHYLLTEKGLLNCKTQNYRAL